MPMHNPYASCINICQCSCIKLTLEKFILTLTIFSTRCHHVSRSSTFKFDQSVDVSATILHSQIWPTKNCHVIISSSSIYEKHNQRTLKQFCSCPLQSITKTASALHASLDPQVSHTSTNNDLLRRFRSISPHVNYIID